MPAARRASRGERTRHEILDAATEHFARHGYEGARIEAIAEDAHLRGPALLYHYKDKRQLYVATLERAFAGLAEDVARALAADAPLADRIEAAVSAWVDFVAARPAVARIVMREGAAASPGLVDDFAPIAAPLLAMLDEIYEEGRRTRVFRDDPVEPLHVASAVVGTSVFFIAAIPNLLPQAGFDPLEGARLEAHRRELLTIVRRLLGLRAPRLIPGGNP